jgi:hypothetical protein
MVHVQWMLQLSKKVKGMLGEDNKTIAIDRKSVVQRLFGSSSAYVAAI